MPEAPHPAYVYDGSDWVPIIGPEGPVGPPVQIKGNLPTKYDLIGGGPNNLPGIQGIAGYAYTVKDTGHIWTWDANRGAWVDGGKLQGDKGDAGETFKISGIVADPGALPDPPMDNTKTPPVPALLTVVMTQGPVGNLFIYDPSSKVCSDGTMRVTWDDASGVGDMTIPAGWVNLGAIAGPQGPDGPQGVPGPGQVPGGVIGQVMTKVGLQDTDIDWADPLKPGEDGQYLRTFGKGAAAVYDWQDPQPVVFPDDFANADGTTNGVLSWDGTTVTSGPIDLESLSDVADVDGNPNDVLTWDGTTWAPAPAPVTKADIDQAVETLAMGLAHEESVLDMLAAPPAAPAEGDSYIVVAPGTGAFAGHDNKVARWGINPADGTGRWDFLSPKQAETHLVEARQAMFTWNGTAWVKVAMSNPNQMQWAPVGTIIYSVLNKTQFAAAQGADAANWLCLQDGSQSLDGTDLGALTGWRTLDDHRGIFHRMSGDSATYKGGAALAWHNSTTAPNGLRATLTMNEDGPHNHQLTTDTAGSHQHGYDRLRESDHHWKGGGGDSGDFVVAWQNPRITDSEGNHTHNLTQGFPGQHLHHGTVALAGDTETAPSHYTLYGYIKVNGRNPSNTLTVKECTAGEYAALATKDPTTLYVVKKP